MRTKTFFSLTAVIVILTILGAGYYFVSRNKPETEPKGNTEQNKYKLSVFIPEKTVSPILSFSGETVWFFSGAGRLYRKQIAPLPNPPHQGEGNEKGISSPISGEELKEGDDKEEYLLPELVSEASQAQWQSEGSNFIVEQNMYGHSIYKFFDADKKVFTRYPDAVREPKFLSSENKIVYDWINSAGGHELTLADFDGSNFQKLTDLYRADYRLETSPVQSKTALFTDRLDEPITLSIYDLARNEFQDIGEPAAYEGVKFSPDGGKLLLARKETDKEDPHLYVYDLFTRETRGLDIAAEISQTAWAANSKELYIATAGGVSKFSLENGNREVIYRFSGTAVSPKDLLVHPTKPIIFFIDAETGYLYKLEIK